MPYESVLPKYARIVNTIQARIEDGTYPPDSMLPSETALIKEFDVSRPTVVRALELLREQGWIDAHHGRGRTVRGRPAQGVHRAHDRPYQLDGHEDADVQVLNAGPVPAPPRAAALLGVELGATVIERRRLVVSDEIGPVELGSAYVSEALASGTDIANQTPLSEGLLQHLTQRAGVTFDHVVERISARRPTDEEARLLQVDVSESLITRALAVCDSAGRPLVALDLQLPASRHELEDVYSL